MDSKTNIIKELCKSLNITQKELSIKLWISLPTIARYSSNIDKMPKSAKFTLNLLLENIELKKQLELLKESIKLLK